ncbi:MAG TPA: fused MFS/spermidine synthase [Pyrinomonadaceae bacterium]|nr:fused MFS/spermidine synthase [Pyrinomonadaceae bacterium]
MAFLFAVTLFLSAFLLFWVQPLVGKMVLPLLGGTPAVWNTCMLFFQGVLLAGYAYVLVSTRWLSTRAQIILHAALLVAAALSFPIAVSESAASGVPEDGSPIGWLLKTLLLTTGLPFFALSASAPLLQKWFSRTGTASASDPYFLYAASNAGSLVALLGFPVLLEPSLALREQSRTWALAYGALVALVLACAAIAWRTRSKTRDAIDESVGAGLVPARDDSNDSASGSSEVERAGTSPAPTEPPSQNVSGEPITIRKRLRWTLLAFVPSSLVLGATTYITTDVAAVPLLWVIPLSLYLLSFVLVFARRQIMPRWLAARLLPGAATLLALIYLSGATQPAWFLILFHLIFLFTAALVCHGQLADERPSARHLAEFYLWLAVGGVLGGIFNALVAPLVFNTVVEYPLVILLASYLRPAFRRGGRSLLGLKLRGREVKDGSEDESVAVENEPRAERLDLVLPLAIFALTAALTLVASRVEMREVERVALTLGIPLFLLNHFYAPRPLRFALGLAAVMLASVIFAGNAGMTLHASRNFFGTLRVSTGGSGELRWLRHGSTLHGSQYTDPARVCQPLSYYHREGPLGSVFDAFNAKPDAARSVAIVGLGAGTTAAYARAGEAWTFYEIDPAVVRVARDPRLFKYLSACAAAPVGVVLGDARLRMRDAPPGSYGLIVLDAFSSDAVPAHLLTREALALYLSKLAPAGLVVFHVSSRSLELERVVGGLAQDAGLVARVFADRESNDDVGKDPSTWVVVAHSDSDLGALSTDARWRPLDGRTHKLVLWRDDFSNVVSVFKWL